MTLFHAAAKVILDHPLTTAAIVWVLLSLLVGTMIGRLWHGSEADRNMLESAESLADKERKQ